MDNNNQPTQPVTTPPAPSTQPTPGVQPTATMPQQPEQSKEGNKMVLWLVGGLILIALVVGGIYWFLSKQQASQSVSQETSKPVEAQVTTDSLSQDLNAVDVESSASSDFTEVDQDLQGL